MQGIISVVILLAVFHEAAVAVSTTRKGFYSNNQNHKLPARKHVPSVECVHYSTVANEPKQDAREQVVAPRVIHATK
jgi:hypothetical protein